MKIKSSLANFYLDMAFDEDSTILSLFNCHASPKSLRQDPFSSELLEKALLKYCKSGAPFSKKHKHKSSNLNTQIDQVKN